MMNRSVFMALGTGVIAGVAWMISSELKRRAHAKALKQEVSRWEGEGGNVPGVETVTPRVMAHAPGA